MRLTLIFQKENYKPGITTKIFSILPYKSPCSDRICKLSEKCRFSPRALEKAVFHKGTGSNISTISSISTQFFSPYLVNSQGPQSMIEYSYSQKYTLIHRLIHKPENIDSIGFHAVSRGRNSSGKFTVIHRLFTFRSFYGYFRIVGQGSGSD